MRILVRKQETEARVDRLRFELPDFSHNPRIDSIAVSLFTNSE